MYVRFETENENFVFIFDQLEGSRYIGILKDNRVLMFSLLISEILSSYKRNTLCTVDTVLNYI